MLLLFQVGLASLLNAQKLYDASYNSIGVHFRPLCQVCILIL